MASGVEVELPESILAQTTEEEENDAKIQQCQRITEVDDTIRETEKDEQQEKDLKVSKGDYENTDGESFLYPPTVEKAANSEVIEKMSETSEARETSDEERSLQESLLSKIESETVVKEDIPQIGISENDNIESDGKEITGILDSNVLSQDGNDSEEKAKEIREPMEHDKEEASEVSQNTKITSSEMSEKYDEKSAEINISDEFSEVPASESDLQKRKEADSDEKEESIENTPTEVDSSQQTEVQTIDQSLPGSNPKVIESIHNVDEEQCSEENVETRDIPVEKKEEQKRSTSPETSILEQSNGNHSLDETLETSIQESEVSQVEENATEPTSSLVDGKIDESEESKENHIEADAKETTGILDGDLPKNENDLSLGNDSAETEDEKIEQDKQESVVLSEESSHNEEGPQVSKGTEFTPLEGSAKEEAKVNDINLETGKTEEEQSSASLESESEKIQETNMEIYAPQNEPASDEKDVPAEVEITQQTRVETFEESLPRSNAEVNESIDKEHCTEDKIESRDFPIESIEKLKRSTSLETGKFEQSTKNLSLDETLDSATQKSEASQLEENAAEPTSTSAEKIDESEESEVTRDENHDLTPNATIEEDSKAHHTEESLTDSHPITEESAKNVEEKPTEVENEEAQPVEQEVTVENIESRNFLIKKTEELERSNAPETTTLEQSNEKMSLEETLDSSKESDTPPIKENATIYDTTFPVTEEIDDTPQNLKAEVNSSTKSIEIEGEADLPDKEREDVIRDATEVENTESQTFIEKEIIDNEEKTNSVDEDSSQQYDDKNTAESDIGENLVTDSTKDVEIVDREFEERNMENLIENQEDIEASQDHSEKTNTSNDEVQLAEVQEETETDKQLKDTEDTGSDIFTDAITTRENPEPVDAVEELDAKSGVAYDDSLVSEQEAKPNEHPFSEENSDGQAQSVPVEDPIYKSEDANQEETEVENQETNIVKEEAKGGDFQDVFEREIADDEVKTNEADEKSSQQRNENAIKSDIAETEDDGDKAQIEIHGTDIVEKERMVDGGFEESNSGNSITNDDAAIEAPQSHKKNTNVSNDEVQLLELKEEAETDKQLENVEDEDSNPITDGTAAKDVRNPEPVDANEKLETVTKLEAIDDNCNASDEANKSVTEGSTTIAEYENEKTANQDLSVVVIEDEMNAKEVQLSGETQSQREEAIDEDQQEVASDEVESKAENEQNEAEESQQKENAGEEESAEHTFEENISSNEEINPENAEVSPSQDEYTEIFEEANQVIKIEEVAALKEQEENLEQEDPTSIIDNVSEEEEATVVENTETQIFKEEAKEEVSRHVVERERVDDEMKINEADEKLSQPYNENAIKSDINETQEDGNEARKIHGIDIVEKETIVDREFEESNSGKSIGNEEATIEASQIQEENTNVSNDVDQLLEPQEGAKIEKQLEDVENEDSNSITDGISAKENPEPADVVEKLVNEESGTVEAYEKVKSATHLSTNQDFTVVGMEKELNDKEVQLSGETQSLGEEAINRDLQEVASNEEKLKVSNEQSETEENQLKDNAREEESVDPRFEENISNNEEIIPEIIEVLPSQDGYTEIPDDTNQVIDVQEETALKEHEENVEQDNPTSIIDNVSAEENPEPVDAVEKLETVTKLEAIDDKEVQLSAETQTLREEAIDIDEDLEEVASDEEKTKAANEQSETEESQQKDNAGEEESVEQTFEENISSNEEINQENVDVSTSQDEYTETFENTNQVIKIQEVAALKEQEENLEQEEATVAENKETQIVKEEAKEEVSRHVVEREIADDKMKASEADERKSQPYNENAIKSDINETQEDGDDAHKIHGTDIVEKEKIVDCEFKESNSGKSIGSEEATVEASQSHEENINVSNDVDPFHEPQEGAKIEKQLEDGENEDSNSITDGISTKENPEPDDAVEKLETVTELEGIDDNFVTPDDADKFVNEESSTVEAYENVKSATHLSTNQDLTVDGIENELNDTEVQLSGETQSLGEEAIDRDLQDAASNEEKLKAANEESETEESQLKDNAREEESVDPRFEENVSNNEEMNSEIIEVSPSQDGYTEIHDDTNQFTDVQEETALKEQEENPTSIIDNVSAEEENFEGPNVDPPRQLDERTSTGSENIESEEDEKVHESGRFNETRELDTTKSEEIVKQEETSDNTIGNEDTTEPNHDENANISTDVIQVIEAHGEAKNVEQEEKLQNENPSIIVDDVSLEENPKQAEDIEGIECSTKSALVIQEEQIDNHGLSITEADSQLEDEESINKENDENQEAKGVQLNEVIQSIMKEALDENIQPPYEEKFVDANADSQQNDESSTTQILNTEVQKNAHAYEESGNEEIQGKETREESGHEEIHESETPTDDEIVDQRLEEIESGNVTSNQETTEVPPHQDECTVISDDGNQATDVQEEVASGKLQENIEDGDTNKMTDNVSTKQNPGPAEAVEKPECSTTSDALIESTITSDEPEKSVTEEGHTEDEDCVNNEGVPNQSSEPVDADEKFDLKQEETEGQDLEETPNMKQEAIKEEVQRETVGGVWNDKGGDVVCESGESNETREIDLVQDDEKVNEDSNSGNATNEETIASYPSEDENANISNDEIQVIGFQEKAKIEEQRENIEDENSSNILEDVSREENVKPAEDDIYTETEDDRSEEGFQLVTNDEETIADGNMESPHQPRESNATELDNTELQREENVHEQSDSKEIHRTDKVFDEETMESSEEQNQELIEASTLNIEDENPIASQNEYNDSNEETQTEVQEEGTVEAQLDSQQDESPVKSADGASDFEDKKLDKPDSGSESTELSEANKVEEEKPNMEVNDLEGSSTRNTTESGSTVVESLITKDRDIDLAECTLEKEEAEKVKLAEVCQINIQTQDIDKRESKEEDLQQPILEKRKDCEVKPMDTKTDNSRLENEKDIYMSDEQYKSVEMDGSDLDKEKEIMNEGIQAAALSNKVQNEHSTTTAEASEQNADVEKDTLSQDVSLYISNDPSQVVEVNETEVTDRECQPHKSEDLENTNNISSAQVEEVKDDLKEGQDIPQETIEKEEKQRALADSGEVKFSITNMSKEEEELDIGKGRPEGNIVNSIDVFSPKEIQQVDNDGVEDILPEIEQLENPVGEEMAENISSQTNEQELEVKNGHTSTTEDNKNIMVVQVPKEEMTEGNSLEKETRDTQDELVSNSEFEPTKDSKLKEELVEEAGNINESSFSSEQSESSEQALNLHGQESIPIQAEETENEMVKNEVNSELILEEKQCEMNVEAQDAMICNTKSEEVKYMDEPSSTHKREAANTEVNDSLHEGIKEPDAEETPAEQASVEESEKTENVEEENLKEEDEKQMVTCYDNMPSSENITLVKDDRKQFSPKAEEVISTPQLEHEYRDVALAENNANQPTEKLHVVHTDREIMLPDCQDVEEVSAADIIAIQIARAIEEEEQLQQQSSEQQMERHEATELVPDMDDSTLENQVPKEESKNSISLEDETEDTYLPEERGIEIEVQKDMHSKQEMVEKVDDSEMSGTEDLPSASPGIGSPSESETNKVSGSSMDSSSQEILNEQEIKDSNKSEESNSSPHVNTINNLIPEENSENSCTTDDNERTASLAKEPEIPTEERTISEELDQDKHRKIISSEFMEDGKTVLTSEVNQAASCDAATEQVAELKVVQETSQGFPHGDTKAQSQHEDPLASARSVEDDEKPAIIAKTVEALNEKVQHSQKTIESPDKVEKAITEVEEEGRTEFGDTLGSGKKEAVVHGKVSPVLDIPETQGTVVVPRTPEATEERKTILTDDFDSPTEQKKSQNALTVKESIILENQQVQAPRGLEEGRVRAEDGENEEIQQTRNMNELENTKIVETKTRSMDSSVITALTSQADGHMTEKVEQVIPKEEKTYEKVVQEEAKTDEEKDESVDQSQEDLEQREMPITAEALGEMEFKATHKKSHNILFGVGSKVKHSISKMKKAIACSTGQFHKKM